MRLSIVLGSTANPSIETNAPERIQEFVEVECGRLAGKLRSWYLTLLFPQTEEKSIRASVPSSMVVQWVVRKEFIPTCSTTMLYYSTVEVHDGKVADHDICRILMCYLQAECGAIKTLP